MSPLCIPRRRRGGACLLALLLASRSLIAQQPADGLARQAIIDFQAACARDHGRVWGRTLCGPIILVDPENRAAVASELPPGGEFHAEGGAFIGRVPDGIPLANYALEWSGVRWAFVLQPVPEDRFVRLALLLHESFHRIQPALGLEAMDALNPQLDERDGRYWLRLELRALGRALTASGDARDRAVRDALLFRTARQRQYPGADTLENSLERAEGLAEYSGDRLALEYLHLGPARVAQATAEFEGRKSYVRALGYGTGPALGLLLDRYAPGWRARVGRESLAPQLARATHFVAPVDPATEAAARAAAYDGGSLAREEDARAEVRAERLAVFQARLVAGPVLRLRQHGLSRAFNPNNLQPFGAEGTVYPTGTFTAEWGSLEVDSVGALVGADFGTVRVALPATLSGDTLRGPGWRLVPAAGWTLSADERAGDLTLKPARAP